MQFIIIMYYFVSGLKTNTLSLALGRANHHVHSFLEGRVVGYQQGASGWVVLPWPTTPAFPRKLNMGALQDNYIVYGIQCHLNIWNHTLL